MSVFFCDSNCELWYTIQEELGIKYIKMPYTLEDKEYYYDLGKQTDFKDFYSKVRAGAVPKTSALNAVDYVEYFEPYLKDGQDILYITFSHKLSATFQQLDVAIAELKDKYPDRKITVFDSGHISLGAGLVVYRAALMHKDGMSDEDIVVKLADVKSHLYCTFTVGDLAYLRRGGRLSKGKAFLGTLLNLKPLLKMSPEGTLVNYAKAKGRKSSLKELVASMDEMGVDTDFPIAVIDADSTEDGDTVMNLIREKYGNNIIFWRQPVGPVIGAHCGPDTVGLVYVSKKPNI